MDLQNLQAYWRIEGLRSDEVIPLVIELLRAGVESPALIQIAGMDGADRADLDPILEQAFREGGLAPIDERTAYWRVAYAVARAITNGQVTPLAGAHKLWMIANALGMPDLLGYFIYLAADYGEGPDDPATNEAWFDARIVETAHELLQQSAARDGDPTSILE